MGKRVVVWGLLALVSVGAAWAGEGEWTCLLASMQDNEGVLAVGGKPTRLYVLTSFGPNKAGINEPGYGLLRSDDFGVSWRQFQGPTMDASALKRPADLPVGVGCVLVSMEGVVDPSDRDSVQFRTVAEGGQTATSHDGGATWALTEPRWQTPTRTTRKGAWLSGTEVWRLRQAYDWGWTPSPWTVVPEFSDDGGISWQLRQKGLAGPAFAPTAQLSTDPNNPRRVLVFQPEMFENRMGLDCVALWEYTLPAPPPPPAPVAGDLDGDGKVTVKDAIRLLRLVVGLG
ncbi:MAG TPA: hypothetical protein VGN26_04015 [Armatimonadota bacterium]